MFIDGNGKRGGMTTQDYAEQVIEAVVGPYCLKHYNLTQGVKTYLYEDENSAHGLKSKSNAAKEAKERWHINYIASPPSSPDFNIIEKIWRILKSRIKAYERSIINIEDMKKAVQKE